MKNIANNSTAGFSLIEVLVAIGIFVLMLSISLPYLGSFYRDQNVGAHCKKVRQALYRSEYRSIAGERGVPWGVHITSGNYTLFAGETYSSRLTQFDETNTLPNSMTYTGLSEVLFSQYEGIPSAEGTVSILLNGETSPCVTVSSAGLVNG